MYFQCKSAKVLILCKNTFQGLSEIKLSFNIVSWTNQVNILS